ncbi:hypothetical protein G7054_g14604 [Neopestalotiopsis clavispora]|nr:hypothetical protein G7054_g14604 [Neopestalotiopsis clavispora]
MRLLNSNTLTVHEFHGDDQCPPYVILSHTWGPPQQECTLQSMEEPAVQDGFEWAWVDTCCIDKTSTAELSEAINSMFRWYKKAEICYAYISDAATIDDFDKSRWFTRGWTLQELVAPPTMRFYSSSWCELGTKSELKDVLSRITGIDTEVLETGRLGEVTLAKKMSWAANRQTTRAEDLAYCLLGIFDVTMPLLYGEGRKSFIRLQEEIMKSGYDFTLFAWSKSPICDSLLQSNAIQIPAHPSDRQFSGLLASSPALFTNSTEVVPLEEDFENLQESIVAAGGVIVRLPTFTKNSQRFAALPCLYQGIYICFKLHHWHESYVAREASLFMIEPNDLYTEQGELRLQKLFLKAPTAGPLRAPVPSPVKSYSIDVKITAKNIRIMDFYSSYSANFNQGLNSWELSSNRAGLHLACLLRPEPPELIERWDTAVLVGGEASEENGLWIAAVPILSSTETESSFHQLLSVTPELIRSCTTLDRLKAELVSKTDSSVFAKPDQTFVRFKAATELDSPRDIVLEAKLEEGYEHTTRREVVLRVEDTKRPWH